jgi:hypothetical protein
MEHGSQHRISGIVVNRVVEAMVNLVQPQLQLNDILTGIT